MYKGYSTVDNTNNKTRLEDSELIKRDVINHFNIRRGEKLMNPAFGCVIWELLFEPLTEDVRDLIIENVMEIINYDPRIVLEDMNIVDQEHGITIELKVRYQTQNQSEILKINFDQKQSVASYL